MKELERVESLINGTATSPLRIDDENHLVVLRVTGTGTAARHDEDGNVKEVAVRNPAKYTAEEAVAIWTGKPVILDHPKELLDNKSMKQQILGTILKPFVRNDEVWGVAQLYVDKEFLSELKTQGYSTSPGVEIEVEQVGVTSSGAPILQENPEDIIRADHVAIVATGVWDKGGRASGIKLDKRGDFMQSRRLRMKNKQDADIKGVAAAPAPIADCDLKDSGVNAELKDADAPVSRKEFDELKAQFAALNKAEAKEHGVATDAEDLEQDSDELEKDADELEKDSDELEKDSEEVEKDNDDILPKVALDSSTTKLIDALTTASKVSLNENIRLQNELKSLQAKFDKANAEPSDSDREAMLQIKQDAEPVFSSLGLHLPANYGYDTPDAYERRLYSSIAKKSARFKDSDVVKYPREAFDLVKKEIIQDALATGLAVPKTGYRKVITRSDAGVTTTKYLVDYADYRAETSRANTSVGYLRAPMNINP